MAEAPGRSALVYLSLGGNLGDTGLAFATALSTLSAHDGIALQAMSSVWRTAPWGLADQPDFLNMVAAGRTSLQPHDLLHVCQAVERQAGRVRDVRWGPRTLDIDIITFGALKFESGNLTLPHPRACERRFVLAPMSEIAAGVVLGQHPVAHWLKRLDTVTVDEGICEIDKVETQRLQQTLAIVFPEPG